MGLVIFLSTLFALQQNLYLEIIKLIVTKVRLFNAMLPGAGPQPLIVLLHWGWGMHCIVIFKFVLSLFVLG